MHVKTYTGKTPAEALSRVKAELGDEAVILSNTTLEDDGVRYCEVQVGIESRPENGSPFAEVLSRAAHAGGSNGNGRAAQARDAVRAASRAAAKVQASGRAMNRASSRATDRSGDKAMSRDDFLTGALDASSRFSREWRQIKQHFLSIMKSQLDFEILAPRQRVAMEYLEREGVAETGLAQVYRRLAEDPGQTVLPVLEELAGAVPFGRENYPQKFHFLVGPHGVGKTSCVLRLGLLAKRANPKARVCLVSAGENAGRKTLRHWAELSGLAFREAASAEDFRALYAEARSFDLVLVDTPALPRRQTLADWLTERGLRADADTALHLVLSPHYSGAQMESFLDSYQAGLASLVWTKLDEACTFGALVNTAGASGLPASALAYGPGLSEGLVPARTEALWRLLFKHQLPGPERPDEEHRA